jgi:hypothetical protein
MGNQMFQYALGRSLATRLGLPLVLDVSILRRYPEFGFDLGHFRLGQQQLRDWPYLFSRARIELVRVAASLGVKVARPVTEPGLLFAPEILDVDGPCVVQGYWQSERYFESIAEQLREEFSMIRGQDPRSAECERHIRGVSSIGLHIRRGDYVSSPDCNAFHGVCPREYYDASLRLIQSKLGQDAELFVFSDDMKWARENIRYELPTTYVDWNQNRNYEDLRLMRSCRALIMANSTFSWWGGWLNPRPDKLAVAPRQWYQAPGVISDLPNSSWLVTL